MCAKFGSKWTTFDKVTVKKTLKYQWTQVRGHENGHHRQSLSMGQIIYRPTLLFVAFTTAGYNITCKICVKWSSMLLLRSIHRQTVKKNSQNCFWHNFVKFPPTLTIFWQKDGKNDIILYGALIYHFT